VGHFGGAATGTYRLGILYIYNVEKERMGVVADFL
jgi:hypothetical protein